MSAIADEASLLLVVEASKCIGINRQVLVSRCIRGFSGDKAIEDLIGRGELYEAEGIAHDESILFRASRRVDADDSTFDNVKAAALGAAADLWVQQHGPGSELEEGTASAHYASKLRARNDALAASAAEGRDAACRAAKDAKASKGRAERLANARLSTNTHLQGQI